MENKKEEINELVKKKSLELLNKLANDNINLQDLCLDSDFSEVYGRCCENILGFKKIPLGISKEKIKINEKYFWVPICTTEGALVASMCRGIKLINLAGGVQGFVENLGITRSVALEFENFREAFNFYIWIKNNKQELKEVGNGTSNFLKIKDFECKHLIDNQIFIKVFAYTGNAMGMNMITKACNAICKYITKKFKAKLITISANTCTDKKWSAENFVNGRGRRVSLSIKISSNLVKKVLNVSVDELIKVYQTKIVLGSSLVLGGNNCQAANVVAGMFLALGQDLGQILESSNCILSMKKENEDLKVSIFFPSIIVGTIGGGTHLKPSDSFLNQFYESDEEYLVTDKSIDFYTAPSYLALTVGGAVLACELSGLAALTDNTLIESHLRLNRKK